MIVRAGTTRTTVTTVDNMVTGEATVQIQIKTQKVIANIKLISKHKSSITFKTTKHTTTTTNKNSNKRTKKIIIQHEHKQQ